MTQIFNPSHIYNLLQKLRCGKIKERLKNSIEPILTDRHSSSYIFVNEELTFQEEVK